MNEHECESTPDYIDGFPSVPGWYDVLVDGTTEARMVFRFCGTCGHFIWQDINGIRAEGKVQWMPGSWDLRP